MRDYPEKAASPNFEPRKPSTENSNSRLFTEVKRHTSNWKLLPKVELHCHFLGIIDPPLLSIAEQEGNNVLVAPETLQSAYPVSDLVRFRQWLDLLKPYQAECAELMRPFLRAHIARLITQQVVYAEIMLSPTIFPRRRGEMIEAMKAWRGWTLEAEQNQVQVEYLMVIPRTLAAENLEFDVGAFIELRRANLIAGVALVGLETGESIGRFASAFARWRDAGLGIEIHAGEHSGAQSVYDALRYGRPHRIGHCLSAFQDPGVIEEIKQASVHVEFCPTSNLRTGASASLKDHPIKHAFEQGISFSLNTDNPGAFGCSMESEYELVADSLGFGAVEFATIYRQSLAARFEPKLRYLSDSIVSGVASRE